MEKKLFIIITLLIPVLALPLFYSDKKPALPVVTNSQENSTSQVNPYTSPISVDYLRSLNIDSEAPIIEEEFPSGSNYKKYLASYISEGNKVYGLLTIPDTKIPDGGFPAIVFNHGYIPPAQYTTTGSYAIYVDNLAKNGFVVFKIDYRGHGKSEGDPSGSYFSSAYTIDAISAVKSLQKLTQVNPKKIGMWGHSMAGNLTLRAMLISSEIKAGVIWAGAVYSYEDFTKYGISDNSYVHRPDDTREGESQKNREISPEIQKIRQNPESIDFNSDFWHSISLTSNINYLNSPLQIHHATTDPVVSISYSQDLAEILKNNSKTYELYSYPNGDHNLSSPDFELAMKRTIQFFQKNLTGS